MYCMHSCGRFGISSAPAAPGVSKPVPSQCPVSDVWAVVVGESAVVHRQPASAARTTTHLQRQPSTEHNTSNDFFTTLPGPCDFHLRQPQSGWNSYTEVVGWSIQACPLVFYKLSYLSTIWRKEVKWFKTFCITVTFLVVARTETTFS